MPSRTCSGDCLWPPRWVLGCASSVASLVSAEYPSTKQILTTKSGDERRVPLRSDARKAIRRLSRESKDDINGPVFTDGPGQPIKPDRGTKRFKFLVQKAKLKSGEI